MNDELPISVSTLLIRQGDMCLVLPGALVAQVTSRFGEIVAVPGTEDWMLGVTAWRGLAVPVISLEVLLAGRISARPARGRLVVCYPLPGRQAREFFALAAPADVRTGSVDGTAGSAVCPRGLRADLIAGALALEDGTIGVIPDLGKLCEVFYK